jgi:hypothetical protein
MHAGAPGTQGTPGVQGTQGLQGTQSLFIQNSQYFRLTSFITIGSTQFSLYSLMYRDGTGAVRPIQRSFTPD